MFRSLFVELCPLIRWVFPKRPLLPAISLVVFLNLVDSPIMPSSLHLGYIPIIHSQTLGYGIVTPCIAYKSHHSSYPLVNKHSQHSYWKWWPSSWIYPTIKWWIFHSKPSGFSRDSQLRCAVAAILQFHLRFSHILQREGQVQPAKKKKRQPATWKKMPGT